MGVGTPSSTIPSHARSFGKYTLLAKLATGGMAEIFLARMKGVAGFEKQVVIKRILPQYADDEQFVAMFLDEARIAARINHPNVCQVYELGEVEGQYFLAMEYLEGVPLTTVLRKITKDGRLPDLRLATALVVQACEGLHNAHELKDLDGNPIGVVHRDVSPQNLFVTIDGTVKVLDFGIAKAQGASAKTRTGTVKGKYAYMSPEQLRGEGLDRRSDVFALGVVLFESVTGRRLFHRETDYLIFKAITDEPIPSVRELRQDLPPALAMTIHKALSRNRDERTVSSRALGQGVAKAMEPYGGLMSQLAVAEIIEEQFVEEIGKVREKISAAVAESTKSDEVARVELPVEMNPAHRILSPEADPSAERPVSRPPQPASRPPQPVAMPQVEPPEQLSERSIDPAHFVAGPPEEPDDSATDVWDGTKRPPWEIGEDEEQPTATAPAEIIAPLVAESMKRSDHSRGEVVEDDRLDTPNPVVRFDPRPATPPQARPGTGPQARVPTGPQARVPTGPQARVPTGPQARVPTGPQARVPTGSQARVPTGSHQRVNTPPPRTLPLAESLPVTSFAMEELRPRRRVGMWIAGALVGLLGAGIYLFIASSGPQGDGGVTTTEARTTQTTTTVVVPAPTRTPAPAAPATSAAETPKDPAPAPAAPSAKPGTPATPVAVSAAPGAAGAGTAAVRPKDKPAPRPAEVKSPSPAPTPTPVRKPVVATPHRSDRSDEDNDELVRPAPRPPAAAPAEPGFFSCDADPYATIYVDGRKVGDTPIFKLSVPAGRHLVRAAFVNGKTKVIPVIIEAGKTATRKFTL